MQRKARILQHAAQKNYLFAVKRKVVKVHQIAKAHQHATTVAAKAREMLGSDRVNTGESSRNLHGTDPSYHTPMPPDVVVFPHTTEEVSKLVKLCSEYSFPIVPYGAGTSLEGHISAVQGGMSIDLSQMDKVVQFNQDDMDITVEAGVTREQVNQYIRDSGLFFPIDPGANASIGGMASTRASGTNAVRYGTMRENVLSLRVVLPNGDIVKTGNRAKKSSSGYDLTRLLIGSEGTLGVITEVTLKLHGVPEAVSAAACAFDDIASAAQTVINIIQYGIQIARVELLDATAIRAVNKNSGLNYAEKPHLLFEFHGTEASVKDQAGIVEEIAKQNGGQAFQWAIEQEERNKIWKARHEAYFASLALRPGSKALTTDVCVPISRLADCISQTKKDMDQTGLVYTCLGHVGDGNFHLIIMIDSTSEQNYKKELQIALEANHRLVMRALSMEGTCTGEHGIGLGKIPYVLAEHGAAFVKVCKSIKNAIDPKNIMNPGKMYV